MYSIIIFTVVGCISLVISIALCVHFKYPKKKIVAKKAYVGGNYPDINCEPARKKLTTLETQRIMGVLDTTIKQSEIITAIPSTLNNIEDMSIVLTRQLIFLLNKYKEVKTELDVVISKLDIIRGIRQNRLKEIEDYERESSLASADFWTQTKPSQADSEGSMKEFGFVHHSYSKNEIEEFKSKENELYESQKKLIEELRFATRCVLIGFRTNPTALIALTSNEKEWKIKREPGETKFLNEMRKLKEIMMLKLMTTPTETNEKNAYLRQMNEKYKSNQVTIEDLELELETARNHEKEQIYNKNEIIKKLQAEIHHIEKISEENIKKTKIEMERQKEIDEKNSESVCQKLQQEIFQKKSDYNNTLSGGRVVEKEMRAVKFKLEAALETDLRKYDNHMREKQDEYELLDEQYTDEKKQLHEMDERFKTLEEEYLKIMEEKRIAEEKREAARREEELLTKAVITIQSFWRSYKLRKGVRGGKKKGTGKGKGKGKKK